MTCLNAQNRATPNRTVATLNPQVLGSNPRGRTFPQVSGHLSLGYESDTPQFPPGTGTPRRNTAARLALARWLTCPLTRARSNAPSMRARAAEAVSATESSGQPSARSRGGDEAFPLVEAPRRGRA